MGCCLKAFSSPSAHPFHTHALDSLSSDEREDDEGDKSSQSEHEQQTAKPVDKVDKSSGGQYAVILTIFRAEGLPGITPSSVFRRPKNKQTPRRYVRVSMTESREGRGRVFAAVTSSVAGSGSTCSWGGKESIGESVSLEVDKDALASLEKTSLERGTESTTVFGLEVWNEASEGGGEDVLLGRGQAYPTFVDSEPQWVKLDPQGKLEISVATTVHRSSGDEQTDGNGAKSVSTQDGLASPLGSDHEQERGFKVTEDIVEQSSPDNIPKPTSPRWGLPRMPDLKDTLNASFGRAVKLTGKQRAQTAGNETNEEPVANDPTAEEVSQPADEAADGGERQVTFDNVPPDEHVSQGKQASRVAIRGMLSIKEGLQARLLGTSGKFSAKREHAQNEKTEGGAELQEDDGARGLASASREEALSSRSSASSNMAMTHDEPGTSEEIFQQDKAQVKMIPRDEEDSGPRTEDIRRLERGRNTHLRTLLQDASAGDQGVRQSEDKKQDENVTTVGDQTARRDTIGEQAPESESPAKGPVAQVVSALDAISAKAAAAKSTLSSSGLTSTLKGFGWNRAKEEPIKGGLSSPSDSSGEPVQTNSAVTPSGANAASESVATERDGSFDRTTPPLVETTVLLVTILRASGLPEVLAKTKFGWAKKNSTQDPVVRLSVCDVSASSSVVQGGGRECRWGTKSEGDIVELSIPSSSVPVAGVGALKLVVEVFNKASDELENDILLGRAEILVGDWLGKKAKWAALDEKRSQGGRVKLRLALKGGETGGGGDASDDIAGDGGGDAPDNKVEEEGLTTPHPDATSSSAAGVGDTVQQTEEAPDHIGAGANNLGAVAQHDGEGSGTAHAQGSTVGVPALALGSVSDGNQQQLSLAEDDASHVSTSAVEKNLEVQRGEVDCPNGSVNSNNDGSLNSDTTKKEEGKEVDISILVIEADALYTRVPEDDAGETPKSSPYVVLHVCGENRATSAIMDGGAKCRWPGAGDEISFQPSYDALTAVGWGQDEAVGPLLTVEVYKQDSQTREADMFIGSANVMLKEHLGFGPKWVDVHRRRKGRGRVLIDVKGPMLQQDKPITGQTGKLDMIGPPVDEEQPQEAAAMNERRKSSSDVLEESGPEGDSREDAGPNRKGSSLSNLSNLGGDEAGKDESADLPRSTASDGSSAGSLGKVRQKQERTSSGADIDASSVDTVGSRMLAPSRQQSQASTVLMPPGEEGEVKPSTHKPATAEGADDGLEQNDENETQPSEARETPDAGASNEETSYGLARRVAGGTATALDLTTATCSSDQRTASVAEEQSAEVCTVITAVVGSEERPETENLPSSGQERDSSRQPVPADDETNDIDRQLPNERQGPSDLHTSGATDKTSNGGPETSNKATTQALDTQPRERATTRKVDPQRIKRAREIIRRRRSMVSNTAHTSPGLRVSSGVGTTTEEKTQAAATIQGAFRGRIARRRLRVCQRAVVKIQAVYRGHVERREFVALSARSKRAKAEEQRARARRSRIALTTQVNVRHLCGDIAPPGLPLSSRVLCLIVKQANVRERGV